MNPKTTPTRDSDSAVNYSRVIRNENPENWQRLAEAIARRRGELGLSQRAAAKQCRVGSTYMNRLEVGKVGPEMRRSIAVNLERGLAWERGSVEAVLLGSLEPKALQGAERPRDDAERLTMLEQELDQLREDYATLAENFDELVERLHHI